ncbi:hypothetical protein PPL_11792 [Heterostelium album PN500]|uniref:Uncharacterized protein n=1 Tax=Heterostelium pallidum (strain ATCC 26659 / Pp 5 / PN500) TaxID=670386 RepID=D3BUH2_HETP5|nr:hypothetical protein PPL_11792 [Heterostelium album PN500]EFA74760.1 hypothetical protein PPL_11792 [Heterostelium album PN500]|eukprot:XP_020426894.1 hypothetical protein PPL_11792 [Heterostelium album PN500]
MNISKFIIVIFINSLLLVVTNAVLPSCSSGSSINDPALAENAYLSDMKMIFSIGDTISAGFLANDLSSSSVNEYRGFSFVTGNETDAWTLNNFLAQTAPSISGGSANLLNGIRPVNTFYPLYDGFNGATNTTGNPITSPLNFVVSQAVGKHGQTYFDNEWKMVTVYLGLFKACTICRTVDFGVQTNSVYWASLFTDILNNVLEKFPSKTIINFVGLPKISQFKSTTPSTCSTYNQLQYTCPCLWSQSTSVLDQVISAANTGIRNSIINWSFDSDPSTSTIGLNYLPFLTNTVFPPTALSPIDCFHPNVDGQKLMTIGLWNNLRKSPITSVTTSTTLVCGAPYVPIYDPYASDLKKKKTTKQKKNYLI